MAVPACPFCLSENAGGASVCVACSRDIAIPATLIAERDNLLRKRDFARHELARAQEAIEMIRNPRNR